MKITELAAWIIVFYAGYIAITKAFIIVSTFWTKRLERRKANA